MPGLKMEISMGAQSSLESAGLNEYRDYLKPPRAEVISQVRDRVVYFIPPAQPDQVGLYLKVFQNKGANHPLRQLLSFETPHSLAEVEARRLRWLEEHDFPAPHLMAWGTRMSGPWEIDSFLVTEDLAGLQAFDEWLQEASQTLPSHALKVHKRTLLVHCARTLARLHLEGFDHPFPYLRHFFVPRGYGSQATGGIDGKPVPPRIAVIDVHTARIGRNVSRTNRQRALAELLLSSLKSPINQTDRLLFLREYCGGQANRPLLAGVIQRLRAKLRRHPNRYRWAREAVTAMPFPHSFKTCSGA